MRAAQRPGGHHQAVPDLVRSLTCTLPGLPSKAVAVLLAVLAHDFHPYVVICRLAHV